MRAGRDQPAARGRSAGHCHGEKQELGFNPSSFSCSDPQRHQRCGSCHDRYALNNEPSSPLINSVDIVQGRPCVWKGCNEAGTYRS
ncbi:MAG: hypothetical protein KTR25_01710 [Myxococcales bacterium]|nr:hypothetical protein [Myxococcales bacterium]